MFDIVNVSITETSKNFISLHYIVNIMILRWPRRVILLQFARNGILQWNSAAMEVCNGTVL